MTPVATPRRLRRHGHVAGGIAALAATTGVAAAAFLLVTTQDGAASFHPEASAAEFGEPTAMTTPGPLARGGTPPFSSDLAEVPLLGALPSATASPTPLGVTGDPLGPAAPATTTPATPSASSASSAAEAAEAAEATGTTLADLDGPGTDTLDSVVIDVVPATGALDPVIDTVTITSEPLLDPVCEEAALAALTGDAAPLLRPAGDECTTAGAPTETSGTDPEAEPSTPGDAPADTGPVTESVTELVHDPSTATETLLGLG